MRSRARRSAPGRFVGGAILSGARASCCAATNLQQQKIDFGSRTKPSWPSPSIAFRLAFAGKRRGWARLRWKRASLGWQSNHAEGVAPPHRRPTGTSHVCRVGGTSTRVRGWWGRSQCKGGSASARTPNTDAAPPPPAQVHRVGGPAGGWAGHRHVGALHHGLLLPGKIRCPIIMPHVPVCAFSCRVWSQGGEALLLASPHRRT